MAKPEIINEHRCNGCEKNSTTVVKVGNSPYNAAWLCFDCAKEAFYLIETHLKRIDGFTYG